MASKFTKVIPPSSTRPASRPTAPARSTASPSLGSKSTSLCRAHARGQWAETRVLNHFLAKKFRLLKSRWRTTYAEIDLLLESSAQEIWIVEVKTLSHFDFLEVRVSQRQKERLKRAHLFVQSKTSKPVRLALAYVDKKGSVLVVEEF